MKKLSLTLLAMSLWLPISAHAIDWSTLRQAAQGWVDAAEKKVNEWVDKVKQKLAEWQSQAASDSQNHQASSEKPAPIIVEEIAPAKDERRELEKLIQESKSSVQSHSVVQQTQPGRAADPSLPVLNSGVPKVDLIRTEERVQADGTVKKVRIAVKEIPRIDIGLERQISKTDLTLSDRTIGFLNPQKATELASPSLLDKKSLDDVKNKKIDDIKAWAGLARDKYGIGEMVTQEKVEKIQMEITQSQPVSERPFVSFSSNDYKMLGALQINKKNDKCHLVAGLYHDLVKDKKHEEEAQFLLGICAHKMGFHSEAVRRLLTVVKAENPDYTADAIFNLVENLPREYDLEVAQALKRIKNKDLIPERAKNYMNFVLARAAHKNGNFKEAMSAAGEVDASSEVYEKARFIHAIGLYSTGKNRDAQKVLTDLQKWMKDKNKKDTSLETLITINLARLMFMEKRYQAAFEQYMKVPKNHPLWVTGLIEQGWTQLNINDAAGAIGNMYSLHSPYFKSVFMPDSWVVRTVGYIDICQYGDAYRTLTKLEQLHTSHLDSLNKYVAAKTKPEDYYQTVRQYIRGKSDQNVDGLAAPVIREIARQRGFLNQQSAINTKEDEELQYQFIQSLIVKDKQALRQRIQTLQERIDKLTADLKKAETQAELAKFVNEWNANRRAEMSNRNHYEFVMSFYDQGQKGFALFREEALARIQKDKLQLRMLAGQELMKHLKDLKSKLSNTLEGNEFLRYEIFAGSGENIRYQVTGGATTPGQRIPASVKPQKILNWQFDGEYWEDEIGSYRSTLRNNCPKASRAK